MDNNMGEAIFLTAVTVIMAIVFSVLTISMLHKDAITKLPDGKQFITLWGDKYWVEKWEQK
jgi:preprotein translocase subunit SecG